MLTQERFPGNAPINSKLQHPPPGKPRAFELLKIGSFKFPPVRDKMVFKCLFKCLSNAPPKEQWSSAPVMLLSRRLYEWQFKPKRLFFIRQCFFFSFTIHCCFMAILKTSADTNAAQSRSLYKKSKSYKELEIQVN